MCKAKNCGGSGLRRLDSLNRALLGKWLWRFSVEYELVEEDYLWKILGVGGGLDY